MKSFAEALSTPEMGRLIAASLERDERRSEEALRWLLGDEEYERMRRSVEADQAAGRFVGVQTTPSPGAGWDPIGGRPVSPDLEASAAHGVGSTRMERTSPCVRGDGCVLPDGHQDLCQRSDGSVILRRRPVAADGSAAELGRALVIAATMCLKMGNNEDAVALVELYIRLVEIHADARVG